MCDETKKIIVSPLGKTWVLDLDGTIVKHNGYKLDSKDTLLEGALQFFENMSPEDKVVFLTSRTKDMAQKTEAFLNEYGIKYDAIIYDMPYGERILINDKKPSGLRTAIAINTERDVFCDFAFEIDEEL